MKNIFKVYIYLLLIAMRIQVIHAYSKRELALFTLDPQRKQHISHITPLKQATPSTMTLKQDTACT